MQSLSEMQQFFNDRTPWMRRMTHKILIGLGEDAHDWDEVYQNVITLAWKGAMSLFVQQRWRPNMLKACLLYAIRQHRMGRSVWSGSTKRRPYFVVSLDMDMFNDERDPIPQVVQTRLDWLAYLGTLSDRWREFAHDILTHGDSADNAKLMALWGVTSGRVSQIRRQISDGYESYLRNSL